MVPSGTSYEALHSHLRSGHSTPEQVVPIREPNISLRFTAKGFPESVS